MIRGGARVLLALSALTTLADAQIPTRADSIAPRTRPDGSRLLPVVLTYLATLQQGSESKSLGERTVQLSRTIYAGIPAWEMIETHGAGSTASVDSLVADAQTLTPFHWGASQLIPTSQTTTAAARVSVEFRADSMIGLISAPTGRRTIIGPMPGGAFLTAAHLETAIRVLPVAEGWRDSLTVMVTDLGKSTLVQAEIAVVGEESIQTSAGTFDCWLVTLESDVGRTQYWVSKADRIVARVAQVLPESGDLLVYALTRISTG
jgi:hypothetical protein